MIGEDWLGGISAKTFAETLKSLDLRSGDELCIRINSPGGSVWDGLAMYNTLLACPARKVAKVEGLAASAASFILQAADEREVAPASFVMIHRAWGIALGDADEMLRSAAQLEQDDEVLAGIYATRSKSDIQGWRDAMAAETWYAGPEAVAAGLADRLTGAEAAIEESNVIGAAARFDIRVVARYRNAPAAILERFTERVMAPAALIVPQAGGQVLNAENKNRATQIRDLAQALLDSATPKESESDESSNAAAWLAQAEISAMEAEYAGLMANAAGKGERC